MIDSETQLTAYDYDVLVVGGTVKGVEAAIAARDLDGLAAVLSERAGHGRADELQSGDWGRRQRTLRP